MGVCQTKQKTNAAFSQNKVPDLPEKPPLKSLKHDLVKNLSLDDSHHFTVFARYHFWNSYRRSLKMCQKNVNENKKNEE